MKKSLCHPKYATIKISIENPCRSNFCKTNMGKCRYLRPLFFGYLFAGKNHFLPACANSINIICVTARRKFGFVAHQQGIRSAL